FPSLACRRPDFPALQAQMFPGRLGERRDRQRDNNARDQRSQCNTESTKHFSRNCGTSTVEVASAVAHRRRPIDEIRSDVSGAKARRSETMSECSFPWPNGQHKEAAFDHW